MPATYLEEKSFFFETTAKSPSTGKPYAFNVVRFTGTEAISRPYEFDVTIVTKDAEVSLEDMLENPCTLYLRPGRKLPVHGVLSTFEQLNEVDGNVFFRAVLVPRLWQLSLYEVSEIYLDLTVPAMIEKVLKEGGLGASDYELRLVRTYRTWSFICQYQETHLNFLSRWMEREGIYYFFEQGDSGEKLIISDTSMVHVDLPEEKAVHYSPPSGMEVNAQKEAVTNFICRAVPVPTKVTLQDFNYRKSPPNVIGEAEVSSSGRGEVLIYGEHVKSNEEATEYAKLRAQEILCRQRVYLGEGTAAFLRVGYFFDLDRHYRSAHNRKYLLTRLEHVGSQAALLMAGVGVSLSDDEQRPYYRNNFEAMESDLQYRPPLVTLKPRFYGTINAKVEAEGDGKYAELDEFGRYKVKFPFDRSDRLGQKASRWIRMAQPFAGPDEGMHFPLRKGAEVLLTFIDGDPDRPIISGAVPGAEGQSVVVDENATRNTLKSSGGNFLEFQDQEGQERILLSTPTGESYLHIGAPNSPVMQVEMKTNDSTLIRSGKNTFIEAGNLSTETIDTETSPFKADFSTTDTTITHSDGSKSTGKQPLSTFVGNLTTVVQNDNRVYNGGNYQIESGTSAPPISATNRTPKARVYDGGTTPAELTKVSTQFPATATLLADPVSPNSAQTGLAYSPTFRLTETIHGSHQTEVEGDMIVNVNGTIYGGASGNTVDITDGNTIEVTRGMTISYQSGGSYEYHEGDSYEYVAGNEDNEVHGNSKEQVFGNSISIVQGTQSEACLSASASATLGASAEAKLAAAFELFVGAKIEIAIAIAFEMFLGLHLEVKTFFLENEGIDLKNKGVSATNTGATATTSGATVRTTGATVNTGGPTVHTP